VADPLVDSRYATALARPLARFQLLLSAAVGFTWGPLLFHFLRNVADWTHPALVVATVGLTVGLAFLGARAPMGYFRSRAWERAGAGDVYVRYFGIRAFKQWMSHGNRMNAWLRRRIPGYRVVQPTRGAAAAYAARTIGIEREHLAWGLAALAPLGYALAAGAYGFAVLLALVNAVTNGWPILLQRYNRVRAEHAAGRGERRA
jgi:hypothetical protein